MSVQGLMQKGKVGCSKLEYVADKILAFPRAMWLGREITVQTGSNIPLTYDQKASSFANLLGPPEKEEKRQFNYFESLIQIIGAVVFAGLSIVASPFLAVGLICKKIALENDPKANAYHQLIEESSKEIELQRQKTKLENQFLDVEDKTLREHNLWHVKLTVNDSDTPRVKEVKERRQKLLAERLLSLTRQEVTLRQEIDAIEKQLEPIHKRVQAAFDAFKKL